MGPLFRSRYSRKSAKSLPNGRIACKTIRSCRRRSHSSGGQGLMGSRWGLGGWGGGAASADVVWRPRGAKNKGGPSSKRSARNSPLTRGTPFALGDFWFPNRGEKCVSSREHDGSRRDLIYVRCLGEEDLNRQERVDLTEKEKSCKDLAVSAFNSFEI